MSSSISFPVRPATLRDAKAIADLYSLTLRDAFKSVVADDQIVKFSLEKGLGYWREAIEYSEPHVQVALNGDKIVGFVGYDRSRDPKTPNTMGEIWSLYAAPDYWGLGVGLALWDAAREGLTEEGCLNVTAWAPVGVDRAVRFFELAGFKREMNTVKTVPFGTVKTEEIRLKRALI
jgi:ribosomal protein S18 acetylase RimI-like enzyme